MNSKHVNLDNKNRQQSSAGETASNATGALSKSDEPDAVKKSEALLPHERDQTTDDKTTPRKVMKQAYTDLQDVKLDTDMHGARGVEEVVKPIVKPDLNQKQAAGKRAPHRS